MTFYRKLATMADIFLDSASVLIETDKTKFHFVILYMLATSIELYLKAIIILNGNKPVSTHELNNLAVLAHAESPNFLFMLTHCLYWKSKYHEANKQEYQKIFYNEDSIAVNYDEIISYAETLKNNYLNVVN